MPKLRDTDDLDVEALEAVEYSTERYTDYTGEIPPIGIELTGYVKKIWWTRSQKDDPMLKVLWIADGNEGEYEEYNGCPFWLNAALIPGAKFRWDPFLLAYGLTLLEVKTKTYVAKEEDQNGFVIERIGTWKPGADRDEAWARIITGVEPYNGRDQAIAAEWLAWDYEPEPDGDGAEEPDGEDGEEPELFEDEEGNLVNAEGELVDEEGNLVDEEGNLLEEEDGEGEDGEDGEEPEPPATPARTRRAAPAARAAQPARATRSTARATQPARAARTASKPATAKTGSRSRSTAPKPAPARTARATASPGRARAAKAPAATPARSTRTKRRGTDNDPPF